MKGLRLILVGFLFVFSFGCATKKFVRTEVDRTDKRAEEGLNKLDKKVEDNKRSVENLDARVGELQELNRKNVERVGQVERATEEAKREGSEAKDRADSAIKKSEGVREMVLNRNNYQVVKTFDVYFPFNRYTLSESEKKKLDEIAKDLKENKDMIVELEGHTDATGPSDYNIKLGEQRVDSVARYLAVKYDVPLHKIFRFSFGKAKPAVESGSKAARKQNRRVTVRILEPKLTSVAG